MPVRSRWIDAGAHRPRIRADRRHPVSFSLQLVERSRTVSTISAGHGRSLPTRQGSPAPPRSKKTLACVIGGEDLTTSSPWRTMRRRPRARAARGPPHAGRIAAAAARPRPVYEAPARSRPVRSSVPADHRGDRGGIGSITDPAARKGRILPPGAQMVRHTESAVAPSRSGATRRNSSASATACPGLDPGRSDAVHGGCSCARM
jgi:hypothetical protein